MERLSTDQLLALKRLNNESIHYESFSESEMEIIRFLKSRGYVRINAIPASQSSNGVMCMHYVNTDVVITEEGKAYLATMLEDDSRFMKTFRIDYLSLAVAIVALIFSAIALFK